MRELTKKDFQRLYIEIKVKTIPISFRDDKRFLRRNEDIFLDFLWISYIMGVSKKGMDYNHDLKAISNLYLF